MAMSRPGRCGFSSVKASEQDRRTGCLVLRVQRGLEAEVLPDPGF